MIYFTSTRFLFLALNYPGPWIRNTPQDFFISYDLRFKLQNSKHTEHLVNFLYSTSIFHNYHSSSLPNAADGFLISTIHRHILRNKNLCILFRSRTFRALNVKNPLVRLIRKVVRGHVRLWKSQIQSQFLTEILGEITVVLKYRFSFLNWFCFKLFSCKKSKSHFVSSSGKKIFWSNQWPLFNNHGPIFCHHKVLTKV